MQYTTRYSNDAHGGCFRNSLPRRTQSKSYRRVVVRAQDQPIPWQKAKVKAASTIAAEQVELKLATGPIGKGYSTAGQFLQIKVGESKPAFMALANAPGQEDPEQISLLIKSVPGTTSELLCNIKEGEEVEVSPVMGQGFKIGSVPPESYPYVFLFAAGTGIAPIKALIESEQLKPDQRKLVKLYYGGSSEDSTAYLDLVNSWKKLGTEVTVVLSDKDGGYVQDAFKKDFLAGKGLESPGGTAAAMAGGKEMCQAVKAALTEAGVADDKILLNY